MRLRTMIGDGLAGAVKWADAKYTIPGRMGLALHRAIGHLPITVRGEHFRCDPDHPSYWRQVATGEWEPETFDIFDSFLTPASVYYDIGAWIGPTVLYASRKARMVYAFEPDMTAYHYLAWNLSLNDVRNVVPSNVALTTKDSLVRMATFGERPGDSSTSLLNSESPDARFALGLSWESWRAITNAPDPTFVKMDVEGAEFSLLPSMRATIERLRPTLYLSTHAPYLAEADRSDKLSALRDVLQCYPTWLDDALQPITADELLSPATRNQFRSFVFTTRS